jgi:hypothetical protein
MDEVLSRNVQQFLDRYDPGGLSSVELRGLFGRLSIEVEAAAECGDLATIPEARQLLRTLHELWPWAGFFLDLSVPLGPAHTVGKLPILAYGLCIVDLGITAWDRLGKCELSLDEEQLRTFRRQCLGSISALGKRAGIPVELLLSRREAVAAQLRPILSLI